MIDVLLSVVLPIFLVAGSGAALQRLRPGPLGALGPAALYLLSPALVLKGLIQTELPLDVSLRVIGATMTVVAAMAVISWVVSRLLRHDRPTESGFMLAGTFGNAGNMGIPMAFLAFGEDGLSVAVLIFVAQGSLSWPVGIYLAARGRAHGWLPLIKAVQAPTVYAVPVALVVRVFDWTLPETIERPISLMADATIPAMLLVLGYQLAQGLHFEQRASLAAGLVTRLLIGAGVGVGLAMLFGLEGAARNTVAITAAMPTAVFTTLLATEFETAPRFVASAVVTSTVASLLTLTLLIAFLQRWP